jgi:hypothetical protein
MWANVFVNFFDTMSRRLGQATPTPAGFDPQGSTALILQSDGVSNILTNDGSRIAYFNRT